MQVLQSMYWVVNCKVARLQPHIDKFTKLATYSASAAKSNFDNLQEGYKSI